MISSILKFFKRRKKKRKRLSYEDYIIDCVRNTTDFDIKAINDIEILHTFPLEEQLYSKISSFINAGDIDAIKNIVGDNNMLEDVTLVKFTNQLNEYYAAAVYDSYEVWQEPIVIEVFKL